jgi:hypothetical protein
MREGSSASVAPGLMPKLTGVAALPGCSAQRAAVTAAEDSCQQGSSCASEVADLVSAQRKRPRVEAGTIKAAGRAGLG